MAVRVMRTMMSRGLRIFGSGTDSTRTSFTPNQQSAFIYLTERLHDLGSEECSAGVMEKPGGVLSILQYSNTPSLHSSPASRSRRLCHTSSRSLRLARGGRRFAGFEHRLEPAQIGLDLLLGRFAKELRHHRAK